MKNTEENTLHMFCNVAGLLEINRTTTTGIPQFAISEAEFTQLIGDIREESQLLNTAAEGKTDEKTAAEEELENFLLVFSRKFYVYARRNNNGEVKALTDIKDADLKKLRDQELIDKAEAIRKKAAEHTADLQPFGISQADIEMLDTKIKTFNAKLSEQGSGFSGRSGARKSLNVLFEEANELLKEEIDGMMESFYETNPDFYNQYVSARGIKNLGVRHKKNKNNGSNSDAGDGKS